jgi:plastocyanin
MRRIGRLGLWTAGPAAAGLALALTSGAAPANAGAHHVATTPVKKVQASNFYFCSIKKTHCSSSDTGHVTKVVKGTKVVWVYKDKQCSAIAICPGHNVKVGSHKKSHTVRTQGATIFSMTFKSVGTFHYVCTHHKQTGMTGTVKVHRPS